MQFDDRYIDKPDDFSRKIGEKVKGHTLLPDPSVWEGIESRLPAKKRTLAPWAWASAGIAAAVIGLLFLLNPLQKEQSEPVVVQDITKTEERVIKPTTDEKEPVENIEKEVSQSLLAEKTEKTRQPSKQQSVSVTITQTSSVITDYLKRQQDKTQVVTENQPIVSEIPSQEVIGEDFSEEETPVIIEETDIEEEIFLAEKTETKPEHSLLAAITGGVGDVGFNFGGEMDYYYADSPLGYNNGDFSLSNGVGSEKYTTLKPSDYSDIQHLPPVSFSIMTGFPLNKTWSIETGLMYTYMTSRFTKTGNITYRGKLNLHYIGIPVNLKATLYQTNNWSVYALGGGGIEKGIFSLYRQKIEYLDGTTKHTNVRSAIGGIQFSVHGATGFGYNINQKIQIFGEPRIIYYFNNNQPMSARTENPFIFGLNGGIKITF